MSHKQFARSEICTHFSVPVHLLVQMESCTYLKAEIVNIYHVSAAWLVEPEGERDE